MSMVNSKSNIFSPFQHSLNNLLNIDAADGPMVLFYDTLSVNKLIPGNLLRKDESLVPAGNSNGAYNIGNLPLFMFLC